jgi:diguanylate cyclase (GGDEF)-like protein/putative nucleotidyltransferase with HDIG domain
MKERGQRMSNLAKAFIALVAIAGFLTGAITLATSEWPPGHTFQLIVYLVLAALSSRFKVTLPGITGTVSVNFIFILLGAMELGRTGTLIITCAATLAQCLLQAKVRPKAAQIAFNVGNAALCGVLCDVVYNSSTIRTVDSSLPVLLLCSSLSYFGVNTLLVSRIIALTENKKTLQVWRENFLWTGPQYIFGAALAGLIHICNGRFGWQYAVLVAPGIYLLDRSYHVYLRRLQAEKEHVSEVADLHLRTVRALALAIDAKDANTRQHLSRVQFYAERIAEKLHIGENDLEALKPAALLHDIGKLAVPEHIISKPGRLTAAEFEKMKIHPLVGAEILGCVNFPYPVVPIVKAHHEKWDGTGYPCGLAGEQIPIGARILAAVDCFDALTSDRPYRPAWTPEKAIEFIVAESGKSYDPMVVEVLAAHFREWGERVKEASVGMMELPANFHMAAAAAPAAGLDTTGNEGWRADMPMDFILSIAAARQEFQMLHEITRGLGNSLRLEDTLSMLAARLHKLIPHDAMAIRLLKDGRLVPQYIGGEKAAWIAKVEIELEEGISGWVASNGRPITNGEGALDPGCARDPDNCPRLRSGLAVPLDGVDRLVGTLTLYHSQPHAFTGDHLRIVQAISSKICMTIEDAHQYQTAGESAQTDELTGLPNVRPLFVHLSEQLARCKSTGSLLTVLVLDLDRFKEVNDRFGHREGNQLLRLVARGLRSHCRASDFVARMGGDEFVLVLCDLPPEALERRKRDLGDMVLTAGRKVCGGDIVSLSAGHASFPSDGTDAEQLLAVADKRMYQVKQLHHADHRYPPFTREHDLPPVLVQ